MRDKVILEIGSGTGLSGLVAANYAKTVVLTDYQDTIIDLMIKNVNLQPKKAEVKCAMLDWMKIKDNEYFENVQLLDKNSEISGNLKDLNFDVIIGSDLIWQHTMIPHLINCVVKVLDENPESIFYHCYMERSFSLHL